MVKSVFALSAESAREYKQDFNLITTVPPNSWSEGSIFLSNCPKTDDNAHWWALLAAAKWQKVSN
jgi:hypothetical protein